MAFTEPLEHAVMSSLERRFLSIGSEPTSIRIAGRRRINATKEVLRSDVFTDQRAIFVTTATDSIEVT